jgi:pyruvyl transferase EpsO
MMSESTTEPAPRESTPAPALTSDAALFASHKSSVDRVFDEHIDARLPVALLQFPYDGNVGNHMMWVAITDYLAERGIPVVYAAHTNNFRLDDLGRAIGRGTILFLGGVTISRLWPAHADVKRQVAAAFPHNRLISLPSTMLFVDEEDRRTAGSIFGDHRDVILLARDPVSGAAAREAFRERVRIEVVHDSTFRLPPQPKRAGARHDIVWLARNDHEGANTTAPSDVHVFDWPDLREAMPRAYLALRASGVFSRVRSARGGHATAKLTNPPISALYRRASAEVLSYGNRMLDRGRVLVTDRLHPHVLAALRGQPVVLLPDRFGTGRRPLPGALARGRDEPPALASGSPGARPASLAARRCGP